MTIGIFSNKNRGVGVGSPTVIVYHDIVFRHEDGGATWPYVSDQPRTDLVPLTLTVGSNGKPTILKLSKAVRDSDSTRADGVEMNFGARIRLNLRWGDGAEEEFFRGYIGQVGLDYSTNTNSSDFEGEGIVCYGAEILAGEITQTNWLTPGYEDAIIAGGPIAAGDNFEHDDNGSAYLYEPVVFNPGIDKNRKAGNATPEDDEGHTYFMSTGRVIKNTDDKVIMAAEPWTAYTATRWLLDRYADDLSPFGLQLRSYGLPHIKETLDDIPISEVDVTGKTALQALAKVLNPVGYGFYITPAPVNGDLTLVTVYPLAGTEVVDGPWMGDRLNPEKMSTDDGQKIQVVSLQYTRAANNARNDMTVLGDVNRLEVELVWDSTVGADLQPFWDQTSDDIDAYDTAGDLTDKTLSTASKLTQFQNLYRWTSDNIRQHAFRSFAWNEDGGLAPTLTTIPNLAAYSNDSQDVIRRPRPIKNSIVFNSAPERQFRPVQVEMGVRTDDSGSDENAWIKIPARIWRDRAGFTITIADLVDPKKGACPYARENAVLSSHSGDSLKDTYGNVTYAQMIYNTLHAKTGTNPQAQFRIAGTIQTDNRVVGLAPLQQKSAWPFKRRGVSNNPQVFKRHGNSDTTADADTYDTRDDREPAEDYAEARRDVSEDALGMGAIVLRGIDQSYDLGNNIAKTRGYEIDLTVNAGGGEGERRAPTVVGITYDFREGDLKTEVMLDSTILGRVR